MNEFTDTIQEVTSHAQDANQNFINSRVAIMVAISATILAICNIKDGNIVQAMSQAQSHSLDSWSYFQAKSIKQNLLENSLELLKVTGRNDDATKNLMAQYQLKVERYEKEKEEIKSQAKAFEKEYEDLNVFDDQFDMTEAFISISIAMFGIASLTKKKWLFHFATCICLVGMTFGITAFFKIPLHPEWLAKILG